MIQRGRATNGLPAGLVSAALLLAIGGCAAASWTATGSMAEGRDGHTANLLADGRVLVTGGDVSIGGFADALGSAELYDPATGSWAATASMTEARIGHSATLLLDAMVLVAGGYDFGGERASAELYDPSSGSWTATGNMAGYRYYHTATLLLDGRVLVVGGRGKGANPLPSAELYDPVSGTWTATGNMAQGRSSHTATLLSDGKVLVSGGYGTGYGLETLASAELYDPGTGSWTAAGRMTEARRGHTATLLPDGRVLVAGGYGISNNRVVLLPTAELYDPVSGTWTATGHMTAERAGHTATLLSNGTVLVVGGAGGSDKLRVDLFDPGTGSWTATGKMVTPREGHTATILSDGGVLVVGGDGFIISGEIGGENLASAELYNPESGT